MRKFLILLFLLFGVVNAAPVIDEESFVIDGQPLPGPLDCSLDCDIEFTVFGVDEGVEPQFIGAPGHVQNWGSYCEDDALAPLNCVIFAEWDFSEPSQLTIRVTNFDSSFDEVTIDIGTPAAIDPPNITNINPNEGEQGTSPTVTITGTDFDAGLDVTISGSGVTVDDFTRVNSTTITIDLIISAEASLGARTITVENEDEQTDTVQFTVIEASGPTFDFIYTPLSSSYYCFNTLTGLSTIHSSISQAEEACEDLAENNVGEPFIVTEFNSTEIVYDEVE